MQRGDGAGYPGGYGTNGQTVYVQDFWEDQLQLSSGNLPWHILGLAQPPTLRKKEKEALLQWRLHVVSAKSQVTDWAVGDRNTWQRDLGFPETVPVRTGVAALQVTLPRGAQLPATFVAGKASMLHFCWPFSVCTAHRTSDSDSLCRTLCPEAFHAVKQMRGGMISVEAAEDYAEAWKGPVELEAVASAVDEPGLGRFLADIYVDWSQSESNELLGHFEVRAQLLFCHKIKFRSAMALGEWASSWLCVRRHLRTSSGKQWVGHGGVIKACFPDDDKDLLFAEEDEAWLDMGTRNVRVTFRVICGSGHPPEPGFYMLELIPKALSESCMASALGELRECRLVQALVLQGRQPAQLPEPTVDLSAWGLNASQQSAVSFALRQPLAQVQGPPGTGKTMTTAVLATCFARQNMISGQNRAVLLCTPTNRAADCAAAFVARICQRQAQRRLEQRSAEGDLCAVCQGAKPDTITLCSHAFHKSCLAQALEVGSRCPICRQQVKHIDTGLRILRIYGSDIEKQEFPVPRRNEHSSEPRKPTEVPEEMRRFSLHWRCHAAVEGERASPAAWKTKKAYRDMIQYGTKGSRADQLRSIYQQALAEARAAELKEADIVFTTCVSSRRMAIAQALSEEGSPIFWQVIIDEAGQATEPEALCPLTFARGAQQICLFGDHQQLRPILKNQLAESSGMAISLFERLAMQRDPQFLAIQYRMNPGISAYPSRQFYGGRLLDDDSVLQSPTLLEHPSQGRPMALMVWDTGTAGEQVSNTRTADSGTGSRMNDIEASCAARVAERLAKLAGPKSVGVLCWYRAQVVRVSELLRQSGEDVHVGSVATAQGSEWDYVLLSTVRRGGAGMKGRLGIVADPHILDVALTRARRGLIVLGHEATLSTDSNWKAFFQHCRETDAIIDGEPAITAKEEVLQEAWARALVPGLKVEIQGLQGAPELNGKTGTLCELNDKGRWEVEVKRGDETRRLALKPSNLGFVKAAFGSKASFGGLTALVASERPKDGVEFSQTLLLHANELEGSLCQGAEVRVSDKSSPCHGLHGTVQRGPDSSGCWSVEFSKCFLMQQGPVQVRPGKKGLEVDAGSVVHSLKPGLVVMLHGLKNRADLNAEWARVVGEAEDGRWELDLLSAGPARRLLMKPENLAPEV
ncbi:unnamed protein product [Effrenium voratum]|nr:unnamed protein product [Effrenium voratum]